MKDEMLFFRRNAIQGALTTPLCKEYRLEWMAANNDKAKLVKLAMRQQSCPYFAHYCYMGNGLSKDYIKAAFGDYINGYTIKDADNVEGYTYGLYVDYDYDNDIIIDKDVVHIMWTTNNAVIPTTKCPTLYVSNKSCVNLYGEGFNDIRIYLFDESKVNIQDLDEESKVTIYKYSDESQITKGKFCFGKVKEFRKELRL